MEGGEVLRRARRQVHRGASCAQLPRHGDSRVRPLQRRSFWKSRLRGERFLLPVPSRGDGQVPEVQRRYELSAHRQRRLLQHHGLGVISGERLFEDIFYNVNKYNGGLSPRRETRLGTGGRSAQEIADGIMEPESLAGLHRWLLDPESEAAIGEEVLRCTQRAGDVLYLPERWFHATIHSSPQTLGFATFCGNGNRWGKAMTQTIRDRREGVEHERAFHDRWGTGH